MPRNQKLTKVIAGRTVKVATVEPGGVLVLLHLREGCQFGDTFCGEVGFSDADEETLTKLRGSGRNDVF